MSSGQSYAVPDIVYDLVTVIHEKSKGLEAFGKYQQDAQGNQEVSDLLQKLEQQDRDAVNQLTQQLGNLLNQSSGGGQSSSGGDQSSSGGQSSGGDQSSGGNQGSSSSQSSSGDQGSSSGGQSSSGDQSGSGNQNSSGNQ